MRTILFFIFNSAECGLAEEICGRIIKLRNFLSQLSLVRIFNDDIQTWPFDQNFFLPAAAQSGL